MSVSIWMVSGVVIVSNIQTLRMAVSTNIDDCT